MKIPLSNPDITNLERQLVLEVLRTPQLCLGPRLEEFERLVARFLGCRYAVATNSGTSGLHLSLLACGIGHGDEVITTPFSFVASANCILYTGATPRFVDIDPLTYNIDITRIEAAITSKTAALLPVHIFGQPCDMGPILDIARRYELAVIEDACEAIGARCEIDSPDGLGRTSMAVGAMGDCGVLAFYPNKQITTGEGGMIVTNHQKIALVCRSLRNQGRAEDGPWLVHERLGYNYRLSEINCALGIGQMQRIEEILRKRAAVAQWYDERLRDIDALYVPHSVPGTEKSWFVYVVQLGPEFDADGRDTIIKRLKRHGIQSNSYFRPIHLQPFYRRHFGYRAGDFPVAEFVGDRTIALPFYTTLTRSHVDYVCETLVRIIHTLKPASMMKISTTHHELFSEGR